MTALGGTVTAFCLVCSATRPAAAQTTPRWCSRRLRCDFCQCVTDHVRLQQCQDMADDYGERHNAQVNAERSAPLVS